MKLLGKSNFFPFFLIIFLSGCVIQSSQLNRLVELIKEPSMDLSPNKWLVSYSDYQSIVYAVSTRDGTLFSNSVGDQILFDGWVVRTIRIMGNNPVNFKIYDDGKTRTFWRGDRILGSHDCGSWQQRKNLMVLRYSQNCKYEQEYNNSILVEENGGISIIRQVVDENYNVLTLTKI